MRAIVALGASKGVVGAGDARLDVGVPVLESQASRVTEALRVRVEGADEAVEDADSRGRKNDDQKSFAPARHMHAAYDASYTEWWVGSSRIRSLYTCARAPHIALSLNT